MVRTLARLGRLDNRWLYAALLLVIVLAAYVPVPLKLKAGAETTMFYEALQRADVGKPVLLESDWDMGTIGELRAQFYCVVRQLFEKGHRFVIVSGIPLGARFYEPVMEELAAEYGKTYGVDWISAGYKVPDPKGISIEALARDFHRAVQADDFGRPVSRYAWLSGVRTAGDWAAVVSINYSALVEFVTYFQVAERTPYLCGVAAISSTVVYPYLSAGTVKGMLVGSRGGGEYEQLLGRYDYGTKFLVGQCAGHLLLLAAIVAGNIGALAIARMEKV